MSKALPIAVAVILGGAALVPVYYASQHPASAEAQVSKNASAVEKISYALGYEVAHQTPPELDINSFVTGVRAGHARSQPAYSEEELKQAYEQFQQEMQQKQANDAKQAQTTSDSFLTENAKKTWGENHSVRLTVQNYARRHRQATHCQLCRDRALQRPTGRR